MTERISLINEIKSGGYEASLLTTFNTYLPFYEDVVLRHLMGSGIRHNVLMMDATQVAIAVDQHPPYAAGRFYTLAPVKVGGAFHPKVILLVGKNKGTLLVGSHNLTLSGFGYNRELTNLIRCQGAEDVEGAALLASAWRSILDWAGSQATALPEHLLAMIRKVEEFTPWLEVKNDAVPDHCRVLATGRDTGSLWQQLVDFVGTEPVHRVTVSGAFFDANLAFLARIQEELAPAELYVGIDPDTVQMPAGKTLPGVSLVNCSGLGPAEQGGNHAGYLHAKSILIERQDGETILAVGSANPSYPAWLAPGLTQNVEMIIARKGAEARAAAEELGLMTVASMPPLTEDDWQQIDTNWRREVSEGSSRESTQVIIALASETDIHFRVSGESLPATIECELFAGAQNQPVIRPAALVGEEYILSTLDVSVPATRLRFAFADRTFTGLIQHVKQMEGLSRTTAQRRFNEALDSLSTGAPNLDQFVECVKDIIRLSDSVPTKKGALKQVGTQGRDHTADTQKEGAELSISQQEVAEQEACRKQRMRGSDDLAYLLDVLLYHLRDETPAGVDDTLEDRDAMGRSEEEQVDADDDEPATELPPATDSAQPSAATGRDPLQVCHAKVGSLVDAACDRLTALSQGKIPLEQLVVILAGILAALRLMRGLEGKVPWIGAGQTAFPPKERRRLFSKIAEVLYDGEMSIINLAMQQRHLTEFDEFSRLKGLIIWLAAESDIQFADQKPFNESLEECHVRRSVNRLYVATAQMIGGDEDVIHEARQSIGQLSLSKLEWFEKLQALDAFIRGLYVEHVSLQDGGHAKAGDFGFNPAKPELGAREIFPRGKDKVALAFHASPVPRLVFPGASVRTISFESIWKTLKAG
jgi:hypothetical protein